MLSNEDALLAANAHHLIALFRADVPSRDRLSFAELTKTFRKLKLLPVGHPPPPLTSDSGRGPRPPPACPACHSEPVPRFENPSAHVVPAIQVAG